MWKFPIGFGKCSFAYLYIVRKAIAELIEDYLLSLEDINSKYKFNIFHTRTVLKSHKLIKTLYRYISFIIFGLLFFYIQIFLIIFHFFIFFFLIIFIIVFFTKSYFFFFMFFFFFAYDFIDF